MQIRRLGLWRSKLAKTAILFFAFLFLLTSVGQAYAQSTDTIAQDSPPPRAVIDVTPTQDISPTTDNIEENTGDTILPTEKDKSLNEKTDKKLLPTAQTQSLISNPTVGDLKTLTRTALPNVNGASGSLDYNYPIVVPPGRLSQTPQVSLSYDSQNKKDGIIGLGWSINIPYIERIQKNGSDTLYTQNNFSSSIDGELVSVNGTQYQPKVENGQFLKYSYSGISWTVTDKSGTVYKFGNQTSTRQDKPTDSTKVFRWMLEESRDTNNNYVSYEYFKNAGQIYPSKITYTGNGTTAGVFTVNFERVNRTNILNSYASGFLVTTNYLINQIRTEVNSIWAKKYDIAYSTADNGGSVILNTITESGQDDSGLVTTLPATDFDYKTSTPNWSYDSSWVLPHPYENNNGYDIGMRFADINGDGLTDILCANGVNSNQLCQNDSPEIWLNNGAGWTQSTTWHLPFVDGGTSGPTEKFTNSNLGDTYLRLVDVNGDGYTDLIRGQTTPSYVYINNKTNGWTYTPTWVLPIPFNQTGYDIGMRMADINGDGLPDILCHNKASSSSYRCNRDNPEIWLNNGAGWTQSTTWTFPQEGGASSNLEAFNDSNTNGFKDSYLRTIDVNGDGLTDLVRGADSLVYTYLNNGTNGWIYTASWNLPKAFNQTGYDFGMRIDDINGDGLPDILCHNKLNSSSVWCNVDHPEVWLNTGAGWTQSSTWTFPTEPLSTTEAFLNSSRADTYLRTNDINGDGLTDMTRVVNDSNLPTYVYFNNNKVDSNLLTKINYPEGGSTDISYKAATQIKDGSGNISNPNIVTNIDVVTQVTNNDGFGHSGSSNYTYEGGKYYFNSFLDRKFAGFADTVETDPAGNVTKTYYHQGDASNTSLGEYQDDISKVGKPYRIESYDNASHLYALAVNKWDKYNLGAGRDFVKLITSTTLTYDGNSSHKDKAEEYQYNNTNGNQTQKINWGEVTASADGTFTDTGTDKTTETIAYVNNTANGVVGLPYQDTVIDQGSVKVNESRIYYDNLALGSVGAGNPTKNEQWKTGTTYINNQKTYNTSNGTIATTVDPLGKITNYTYDSYNLYPATVTNSLSQPTAYTYDYTSGQVKQITDPNSRIYQTVYDGLDRVVTQKQPDIVNPATLVNKTTYAYTDTSGSVKIKQTDYLDGSNSVDTYTYFDGLNRPIQTRKEMETSNTFAIVDTIYNTNGQVYKQSAPYSSTGTSKTAPTTTSALLVTNTYDAMGRITSVVNSVGTTSSSFDDWKVTITNPRGKIKDLYSDAYGNLVRVDEHNGSNVYTTSYVYNRNGNLVGITDALGNIRGFTYDGLGHRLNAQDLHATGDSTFGTWTYTYDDAGNLSSELNPNGQTINYSYDDLSRIASEDYTGQPGTEVVYGYDSGVDGIGRLTSVSAPGVSTVNSYDANGNLKQEVKTINLNAFTTSYTYDRLGNQLTITDPDNSQVKYTYNTAGQLETVQRKEFTDSGFTNVIGNFDYGPHGKVIIEDFQNGTSTTNTYDDTKLYRLSNKATTITGGSKVQDLTFTYDANNNIIKTVDASATNSSKTVDYTYDDLDRLLSADASSVASGQSSYNHNYTYDAIGNLLTRTDAPGTYSYTGNTGTNYANPHAVTSVGSTNYTYDNNGNMLTETGGLTNVWDYNNRLSQSIKGGVPSTYAYDENGQRVKSSNVTTTTYYPNSNYNTDGTTPTKQIFANGLLVATISGTGLSASVYSVHNDNLGGSSIVTNSSGTQEELMDYFSYGNIRLDQKAGAFDEKRKFTGLEYDVDTGLNYANSRYYNPGIGRFVSQDPAFWNMSHLQDQLVDPQSWNSYAYARNNPLAFTDPNGQFWTPWQSSGGFTNWMGNGGFLHNIYGNNVNNISNQVQNIVTYGPTKQNVTAIAKQTGLVVAKTAGVAGGAIAVGAGAGAISYVLAPPVAATTGTACVAGGCDEGQKLLNPAINITSRGLQHIEDRHMIDGVLNTGKSVFNSDVDVQSLIRSGSQQVMRLQGNDNYQRVFDTGKIIGVDQSGRSTSWITIITNKANDLITSHPGVPKVIVK